MPTRPTTPEQREDAKRLKAIYQAWVEASPVRRTQDDVAEAIGVGQSTVAQTLSGRLALNAARAAKLAKLFGCAIKDFSPSLAGHIADISGIQAAAKPSGAAAAEPIPLVDNPNYPSIRRVRFRLSAGATGFGIDYDHEGDDAPIVFHRTWYAKNGYRPADLFAVRVANGSMETGLYDGDSVVVNTADVEPRDGEVFAVNYEGELVIKRMLRDGGAWWLSSDNPDQRRYPRKSVDENVRVLGRVVHKQSERI